MNRSLTWLAATSLLLPSIAGAWMIVVLTPSTRDIRMEAIGSREDFANALVAGALDEAFAFIRAGADLNAPLAFQHERLTAGRSLSVAPLLVAIAARQENAAMMLLSFGARIDATPNRYAVCLARVMDGSMAERLEETLAPGTAVECPEARIDPEVPLGWIEPEPPVR